MLALKRSLLLLAQLAVLLAFGWAIEHWWGFERLLAPWAAVPVALVLLVVFAQLASYSLRALRIYLAEPAIPRGRWPDCLRLILLNNALNLLLPARTGEASFPLLLKRWFGVDLARGAGTLLWLRLLDLNVLGALAAAVLGPKLWSAPGVSGWRVLALMIAALPLLAPAAQRLMLRWLADRDSDAVRLLRKLMAGIPSRERQVLLDLLLTWSAWGIKLAALAAVFALLAGLSPSTALLGAIGGDLSTVLPIHTPGGFGTYEAGVIALVSPLSAPSPALLAAAVNLHLLVLGVALGAGALAWLGRRDPVRQ